MDEERRSRLESLLRSAREGNPQARDQLFATCRNYLQVLARAQLGSWLHRKVDASDLVQQTMLEAHRGWENFQGQSEGEWLAWLRRILSHNAADFVRQFHRAEKRRISKEVPLDVPAEDASQAPRNDPPAADVTPSVMLMERELEIELADAITRLPEDYQEVILLRNLERLPFDQVAERMNRSRPATQMLWMRAIKKLKETMGEES